MTVIIGIAVLDPTVPAETPVTPILAVVTAPLCSLAVDTVLSAGTYIVVLDPISIAKTVEPLGGAVANRIVSESVK